MKKFVSIVGIFILTMWHISVSSAAITCQWDVNDSTKLIVSGSGGAGVGNCPSNYADAQKIEFTYGITSIGNYQFYNMHNLTSVSLPESVTSLGQGAFAGADLLTSIKIPANIRSIGNYAFCRTGLTELVITDNLTAENVAGWTTNIFDGIASNITSIKCVDANGNIGNEEKCAKAIEKFIPDEDGKCHLVLAGYCLNKVQKVGDNCVGQYFASTSADGTCVTKADCTENGAGLVNPETRECMSTQNCTGEHIMNPDRKQCVTRPDGCVAYNDGCKACDVGYKNMGDWCRRVFYTMPQADALTTNDNNNWVEWIFE